MTTSNVFGIRVAGADAAAVQQRVAQALYRQADELRQLAAATGDPSDAEAVDPPDTVDASTVEGSSDDGTAADESTATGDTAGDTDTSGSSGDTGGADSGSGAESGGADKLPPDLEMMAADEGDDERVETD